MLRPTHTALVFGLAIIALSISAPFASAQRFSDGRSKDDLDHRKHSGPGHSSHSKSSRFDTRNSSPERRSSPPKPSPAIVRTPPKPQFSKHSPPSRPTVNIRPSLPSPVVRQSHNHPAPSSRKPSHRPEKTVTTVRPDTRRAPEVRIPSKPSGLPSVSHSHHNHGSKGHGPRNVDDMVKLLRGTRGPAPVKARSVSSAPSPHGKRHDDRDHHSHGSSLAKYLVRSVRVSPKVLPWGCTAHTYVGGAPVYLNTASGLPGSSGYYPTGGYQEASQFPGYAPVPTYENAPRFGSGSAYPEQISYRVDPTSQLSTQDVRFHKNSADFADAESVDFLINLAAALNSPELIDDNFVVEGHASAEGSSDYNRILSQQRANTVFSFLASRNVDPARLLSVGYGEDLARYSTSDPEYMRAEDRRVVVFKLAE